MSNITVYRSWAWTYFGSSASGGEKNITDNNGFITFAKSSIEIIPLTQIFHMVISPHARNGTTTCLSIYYPSGYEATLTGSAQSVSPNTVDEDKNNAYPYIRLWFYNQDKTIDLTLSVKKLKQTDQ